MFFVAQRLIGYACILIGLLAWFMNDGHVMFLLLFIGGFVLASLASIVEYARGIYLLQAGLAPGKDQLSIIIKESPKYDVYSKELEIKPVDGAEAAVIDLAGDRYIRTFPFLRYIKQEGAAYTFSFPGMEPYTLTGSNIYVRGTKLFVHQEQAYVLIPELRLDVIYSGDEIWFEPIKAG